MFSQIVKGRSSSTKFNREKRFEEKQLKQSSKTLFYTGISQWGMKTSYQKKDLLSTLSTHNNYSKSVYYRWKYDNIIANIY